jgi:hypothetical protein
MLVFVDLEFVPAHLEAQGRLVLASAKSCREQNLAIYLMTIVTAQLMNPPAVQPAPVRVGLVSQCVWTALCNAIRRNRPMTRPAMATMTIVMASLTKTRQTWVPAMPTERFVAAWIAAYQADINALAASQFAKRPVIAKTMIAMVRWMTIPIAQLGQRAPIVNVHFSAATVSSRARLARCARIISASTTSALASPVGQALEAMRKSAMKESALKPVGRLHALLTRFASAPAVPANPITVWHFQIAAALASAVWQELAPPMCATASLVQPDNSATVVNVMAAAPTCSAKPAKFVVWAHAKWQRVPMAVQLTPIAMTPQVGAILACAHKVAPAAKTKSAILGQATVSPIRV